MYGSCDNKIKKTYTKAVFQFLKKRKLFRKNSITFCVYHLFTSLFIFQWSQYEPTCLPKMFELAAAAVVNEIKRPEVRWSDSVCTVCTQFLAASPSSLQISQHARGGTDMLWSFNVLKRVQVFKQAINFGRCTKQFLKIPQLWSNMELGFHI